MFQYLILYNLYKILNKLKEIYAKSLINIANKEVFLYNIYYVNVI